MLLLLPPLQPIASCKCLEFGLHVIETLLRSVCRGLDLGTVLQMLLLSPFLIGDSARVFYHLLHAEIRRSPSSCWRDSSLHLFMPTSLCSGAAATASRRNERSTTGTPPTTAFEKAVRLTGIHLTGGMLWPGFIRCARTFSCMWLRASRAALWLLLPALWTSAYSALCSSRKPPLLFSSRLDPLLRS